jgi:hypothetical protein
LQRSFGRPDSRRTIHGSTFRFSTVDSPGMYRIGLNLLRRRKSSFIHGAEDDARDLTDHLVAHLGVGAGVTLA